MLSDNQLAVGFCATEHQAPHPVVQEIFHKLYHTVMQPLSPTFACKFTKRDCAKILTKLKQNNNHCSSLDISSQKAISYSAIRSSGISIFLLSFLFLCKENSANKSHKEIKAPLFPFDINHEQHWNVNKAQAAFFLPEKKLSITNVYNSGERRLLVLIPLPWNCKGHQGTLSEISSASNSMFLPWGNR